MKEFRTLLKTFKRTEEILGPLMRKKDEFSSQRLRQLLSYDDSGGMMPINFKQEIDQFEKLIVWKKVEGADVEVPEPQRGLDENFDSANDSVTLIKQELDRYLDDIRG